MAKEKTPTAPTKGQLMAETLATARAARIREARARIPQPTYEQVAVEVGCCVKTVWNVCNNRTHAAPAPPDAPAA
jgi:hypothetical protein